MTNFNTFVLAILFLLVVLGRSPPSSASSEKLSVEFEEDGKWRKLLENPTGERGSVGSWIYAQRRFPYRPPPPTGNTFRAQVVPTPPPPPAVDKSDVVPPPPIPY